MTLLYTSRVYLGEGRHEYEVEELRPFFVLSQGGERTCKDAGLLFPIRRNPAGPRLSYEFVEGKGFSLIWKRGMREARKLPAMISVHNRSAMRDLVRKRDYTMVPAGSLLPGEKAFEVIEHFAANPDILSGAVDWTSLKATHG